MHFWEQQKLPVQYHKLSCVMPRVVSTKKPEARMPQLPNKSNEISHRAYVFDHFLRIFA